MTTQTAPAQPASTQSSVPVVSVEAASRHYSLRGGVLKAVDDVTLTVHKGKTLGIVGESGCGKTTLSRLILRLEPPTLGKVLYKGEDLRSLSGGAVKAYRRGVSAVFQDPYSSLNPRHRVDEIVLEPVKVNIGRSVPQASRERLQELLRSVGLPEAAARLYPHEFSGGQRQRVAIARSLSVGPDLIVLDEPVSALDVSIRAQILNLLKDLQAQLGVAYLFIAHDLAAVRHMSDEVAVMYLGSVVEQAPVSRLYGTPAHPYTRGLLAASLPPDPRNPNLEATIQGEIPSPIDPPSGCRFRTRCPIAVDRCAVDRPALRELDPGHLVACHLAE
jgi:oligopeptide/dipeptide ABC transporter ATP-binding protein